MKYKTLESAAEAAVAQAKLHSLVDALYQGDKLRTPNKTEKRSKRQQG